MPQRFTKDVGAKLDFSVDWTEWLADDLISESTWEVDEGLTISDDPMPSSDGKITTVWLVDGVAGQNYRVVNHIKTVGEREDERTLTIYVTQR